MILEMKRSVQGALLQERKFDIISNNLANADTTGFKADVLAFDQILKAKLVVDFSQGGLKSTGNKLDLALADEGFFQIQTPRGIRYTRDGNFTLNQDRVLVTQNGDPVLGEGGPITIEGSDISVSEDGEILVDGQTADRLNIVTFNSLEKLEKEGASLFVYKGFPGDETAPEKISVKQEALEMPNVTTVGEMTKMIETMRNYEAYQKLIQSFDEADAKAVNEVGRPQ